MSKPAWFADKAGRLLVACGLVASITVCPGAPVEADDAASTGVILERMARAYRAVATLSAELEQVKSYPQLGVSDTAERGVLFIKRKGEDHLLMRLEIRHPQTRILTVDGGGGYVLYQPGIRQAIEGRVDSKAAGVNGAGFLRYMLGDLSGVEADYEVACLGEENLGDRRTARLRLRSKAESRAYYRQIDLWIDEELWLPVQQELVEPNSSVTTLRLRALRMNEDMKDSLFLLDIPKGVERIRG